MGEEAKFFVGQIVHHRLFDYRGVVFDVDPRFLGSEEWYEQVARTRPPKDRPWYRILVDGRETETYVAERNLEPDREGGAVDHSLVEQFFLGFENGIYLPRQRRN